MRMPYICFLSTALKVSADKEEEHSRALKGIQIHARQIASPPVGGLVGGFDLR